MLPPTREREKKTPDGYGRSYLTDERKKEKSEPRAHPNDLLLDMRLTITCQAGMVSKCERVLGIDVITASVFFSLSPRSA